MTTAQILIAGLVTLGAGLSFLNALGAWLTPRRRYPDVWLVSCLFVCLALFLMRGVLELTGQLTRYSEFGALQFTWSYLIGPLMYLWFRATVTGGFQLSRRHWLLLAIVLPFLLLDVSAAMQPETHAEYFDTCLLARLTGDSSVNYMRLSAIAAIAVYASNGALFVATLLQLRDLWRVSEMPPRVRLLWIFLAGALVAQPLLLISDLLVWPLLGHAGLAAISLMFAAQYLARIRDPELVQELRATTQRKSYERSAIQGVDAAAARDQLDRLMRDERLYLDEELSLEGLAAELGLSRHQLSGLLNETIGKNFHTYLNEFRVAAACDMLRRERRRSVLSIAHAVGFNSKSSFHSAFQKFTGHTPLQYRAGFSD
ncbi:MAG: helix-turn-helix domain-containing protein [bacterium]|nr:helix-turn-helix domain-containing protein [bacterium]